MKKLIYFKLLSYIIISVLPKALSNSNTVKLRIIVFHFCVLLIKALITQDKLSHHIRQAFTNDRKSPKTGSHLKHAATAHNRTEYDLTMCNEVLISFNAFSNV